MIASLPRRAAVGLATALVAVSVSLGIASPAAAHDQIIDSFPAADEVLAASPGTVSLTFSGPPQEIGTTVLLVDAQGDSLPLGEMRREGSVLSADAPTLKPDQYYQVRWRVVSGDGHVLSGAFDFGVGDVSDAKPVGTVALSAPPPNPYGENPREAAQAAPGTGGGLPDRAQTALVAAGGAGVALAGFVLVTRRRPQPAPASHPIDQESAS